MKNYLSFLILLFVFSACQEVIDVELRSTDPKYVVEGVLTDNPGDAFVKISQTARFYEPTEFNGVAGATVSIREVDGTTWNLTEGEKGIYRRPTLMGKPGKTYELRVQVGGQEFSATSTMPAKVLLDSLYITEEMFFTQKDKLANVAYTDAANQRNNYLAEQSINSKRTDMLYIYNDEYTDGKPNIQKLYYFPENDEDKLKKGDTVKVNFYTIDEANFKYWFSVFRSSTGQSGGASPANPVSNIQGGALGYFSAQPRHTKSVIVP